MEDALLLSRWWLLLTAPACVVGLGLIVASVLFLLRTIRVPEFARLPLVAEQDVDLEDTGPLSFVIDHPRFNNVQANAFKPFALAVSLENAAGRVVNADKSLMADIARAIEAEAAKRGCTVVLPTDAVVATALKAGVASRTVDIKAVPKDQVILDVGPATAAEIARRLETCRTLVWNGPLGAFETAPFERGTVVVAQAAAKLTEAGKLLTVAGGGDTVAALSQAGVLDKFSYVSTAGGAFLEWLEGKELPGVAALKI